MPFASAPLLLALALLAAPPGSLAAQDVPSDLAAVENERSRACTPVLVRLGELERELAPLAERADRIAALFEAVILEDSGRVAPFDASSPIEASVARWFERDAELAGRVLETSDEAAAEERVSERAAMLERLEAAYQALDEEADAILGDDPEFAAGVRACDGAILVRPAVVEACGGLSGPLCEEARAGETTGRFRFVEAPEDLWDVEQLRPWTEPAALQPTPQGQLGGARTGTLLRRGNVHLLVGLEPMIRERDALTAEEAAEFDERLENMGFAFADPRFVMAPALVVDLNIPRPLAGESHYLLHFDDLSDPPSQVFWVGQATDEGPIQQVLPAEEPLLVRLAQGHEVNLTAVRLTDEEAVEGEVVYTLALTAVNQAEAITALLAYMAGGQFEEDFSALVGDPGP